MNSKYKQHYCALTAASFLGNETKVFEPNSIQIWLGGYPFLRQNGRSTNEHLSLDCSLLSCKQYNI